MTDLPTHILIVEDEADIRRFVRLTLETEGHTVHEASTLQRGLIEAGTRRPDLVVLDLGLPDGDGVDLIRDLRTWSAMPIIVLSARSAEASKIAALDAGADDYLVKPFAFAELVARLRALIRRDVVSRELCFQADDLEMNLVARSVVRGGVEIDLTRREFELLEFLLRNKNSPVTREMIGKEVWKEGAGTLTNTIDVYITLLRKKIEKPDRPALIHTVRGVGYMLKDAG